MTDTTNGSFARARILGVLVILTLTVVLLYNALFSFSYAHDANYRNVTVDTRVNVTQAKPELLSVAVDTGVTLNAGSTKLVSCNASIRDYNGYATITNVSAVYWDNSTQTWSSPDDNNDHYTNLSCTMVANDSVYIANFTCGFYVWYYANSGNNWRCNVTATDNYLFNASVNRSNSLTGNSSINNLLALNVTSLVDYGNMAVGDTSDPKQANITNFGNRNINISLKGYGNTTNDGLAMSCFIGSIAIANEKYGLNISADYSSAQYTSLTSAFVNISGLTLPQQTNDSQQVVNSTYWRLYIPPNPFGQCNGTIIFQAEQG